MISSRRRKEFRAADRLAKYPRRFSPSVMASTVRNMHAQEHGQKRFASRTQAAEWDARYSERDGAMWSGRPNGRLVAEAARLTRGRAFDVGCGEGADAIWLARSGWTVTAIDLSDLAVRRAREAAELAEVAVDCVRGDALHAVPGPLVRPLVDAIPSAAQGRRPGRRTDTARHGAPRRVAGRRLSRP